MKKRKTKGGFKTALCLVLALAMCAGLMPSGMTAFAADDAESDGAAYPVTLNQTAGGTLSFADADGNCAEFSAGDEVTVRIEPDGGYAFLRITLSADDGAVYETDDTADLSVYTFTMPGAGLTVEAEFCDEADLDYSIQTLGGTVSRTSRVGSFLGEGDIAITEDEFYELFDAFMDDSHVKNTNYSQSARWDCSGMVNYFVGGYLIPYSEGTPIKNLPDEDTYETYKYKTTIQQFDSWGTVIYDDGTYGENISKLSNTNPGDLQPGDLIFYGSSKTYVTHVAMYVGEGSTLKELRSNSGYNSNGFYQVENESSANQYFYPVEGRSEYLGASGNGVRVNRFHLATSGNSYGSIYDSLIQTYDSSESAEAIMVVRLYENTPDGYLTLEKTSQNPSITDGNSCYSFEGAVYWVYTDSDCTERAKDADGNYVVLTTDEYGHANTVEMEVGKYYAKEVTAPKGYELEEVSNPKSAIHVVEVTANNTEDDPAVITVTECPANDPGNINIYKEDAETGEMWAQGAASLEGAQFTVCYYDYDGDDCESYVESHDPTRTWVIETKYNETSGEYYARLGSNWKVSGDDFCYDDGAVALPLGTYTIQETKAPEGYLIEGDFTYGVGGDAEAAGNAGEVFVTQLLYDDDLMWEIGGNYYTREETVIRGGVEIQKRDWDTGGTTFQGNGTFADAVFEIVNNSENAVAVDKNGNGELEDDEVFEKGEVVLTLTTDADGYAATTADALPYGDYIIREAEAPEGYLNEGTIERTFEIREDGVIVDMTDVQYSIINKVIRGGVEIQKRDVQSLRDEPQGNASFEGITLEITNDSEHFVMVDSDGDGNRVRPYS